MWGDDFESMWCLAVEAGLLSITSHSLGLSKHNRPGWLPKNDDVKLVVSCADLHFFSAHDSALVDIVILSVSNLSSTAQHFLSLLQYICCSWLRLMILSFFSMPSIKSAPMPLPTKACKSAHCTPSLNLETLRFQHQ